MSLHRQSIVLPLLQSDLVTAPTKAALEERLGNQDEPFAPAFFSESEFKVLASICARLLGEPLHSRSAALQYTARQIDQRLARRITDGWRYDALPSDGDAYKTAIALLADAAAETFDADLTTLDDSQVDQLLALAADNQIGKNAQPRFNSALWFEELLAEAVECFYSHPDTLNEIAYVGFSDARGWDKVGINQLEPREAAAKVEGNH